MKPAECLPGLYVSVTTDRAVDFSAGMGFSSLRSHSGIISTVCLFDVHMNAFVAVRVAGGTVYIVPVSDVLVNT